MFEVDLERLRRRRTVKWTLYGPDVLAAWVAEMDFDVAPPVRDAIVAAVEREDFGYVEGDLRSLTEACAQFLSFEHGWNVPPTRIFPIADVLSGITGALDALVVPAASVVVPTPAYPPFFEIIELTGRPVVAVPLREYALDLDAIERAFSAGARAILLCNPHNPTGRVFTRDELGALAKIVDRHGVRVIADEVHAPIVYPGGTHIPYASISDATAAHTITVTSASKAFNLAGLKCAQVITTNHDDAARWRAMRVFEVPAPTPIGVAASIAAYRDGRDWLHALVTYLDGNRHFLHDALRNVSLRRPEGTFLAWLDCSALGVDDPARFFLDNAHVALSDGPPFGPGCEQFVRLNFATSRALLERIVSAMRSCVV